MGSMSKASVQALQDIVRTLRKNCDKMETAKSQMDKVLNGVVGSRWNDPVAYAYREKYEQCFNPIRNKLLVDMRHYADAVYAQAEQIRRFLENRHKLNSI